MLFGSGTYMDMPCKHTLTSSLLDRLKTALLICFRLASCQAQDGFARQRSV